MLKKSQLRNQRGISTVELIPILLLFALMFNFTLGFFGVIHSGILNSIAARNYAFETFRNRANLNYFRDAQDNVSPEFLKGHFSKVNFRFHGIISEGHGSNEEWIVTRRPIKFTEAQQDSLEQVGNAGEHNQLVRQITDTGKVSDVFTGKSPDEGRSGVSPVWIQTLYGICLNSKCQKAN
jgi:hypothetical protein